MQIEPPKDASDIHWLRQDILQRKTMRSFWKEYRRQHQLKLKKAGLDATDIADDMKHISADNDPEFQAALAAERQGQMKTRSAMVSTSAIKGERPRPRSVIDDTHSRQAAHSQGIVDPAKTTAPENPRSKTDTRSMSNVEVQSEWGSTPSDSKPDGSTKTKIKTKTKKDTNTQDVSASIDQDLANLNITVNTSSIPDKIRIKKSAFEVISTIFARQRGKGVLWDKFVDAMAKVGFMSRFSGGSAVTFEPGESSKWSGQGSIVFHRPHPNSTIDAVMLGSIGKRMKKWFGWGAETFEVGK